MHLVPEYPLFLKKAGICYKIVSLGSHLMSPSAAKTNLMMRTQVLNVFEQTVGEMSKRSAKSSFKRPSLKRIKVKRNLFLGESFFKGCL